MGVGKELNDEPVYPMRDGDKKAILANSGTNDVFLKKNTMYNRYHVGLNGWDTENDPVNEQNLFPDLTTGHVVYNPRGFLYPHWLIYGKNKKGLNFLKSFQQQTKEVAKSTYKLLTILFKLFGKEKDFPKDYLLEFRINNGVSQWIESSPVHLGLKFFNEIGEALPFDEFASKCATNLKQLTTNMINDSSSQSISLSPTLPYAKLFGKDSFMVSVDTNLWAYVNTPAGRDEVVLMKEGNEMPSQQEFLRMFMWTQELIRFLETEYQQYDEKYNYNRQSRYARKENLSANTVRGYLSPSRGFMMVITFCKSVDKVICTTGNHAQFQETLAEFVNMMTA